MEMYSLLSGGIAGWWARIEDAMVEAGVNTIIGVTVVFAALLFISFVISLFKYISVLEKKLADRKDGISLPKQAVEQTMTQIAAQEVVATDDLELIAVITAAIHAYEAAQGNTVTDGLVVRSIRKRNSRWQNA